MRYETLRRGTAPLLRDDKRRLPSPRCDKAPRRPGAGASARDDRLRCRRRSRGPEPTGARPHRDRRVRRDRGTSPTRSDGPRSPERPWGGRAPAVRVAVDTDGRGLAEADAVAKSARRIRVDGAVRGRRERRVRDLRDRTDRGGPVPRISPTLGPDGLPADHGRSVTAVTSFRIEGSSARRSSRLRRRQAARPRLGLRMVSAWPSRTNPSRRMDARGGPLHRTVRRLTRPELPGHWPRGVRARSAAERGAPNGRCPPARRS